MTDFRIENRTLTDRPFIEPEGAYIYQHIHVRRLLLPELSAHLSVAAAAAKDVFGIDFRPDLRETDSLCRRMLLRNRYPEDVSSCIEMRLYPTGDLICRCGEIFAGDGLAIRHVRPEATTVCYDIPFGDAPTSVRRAANEMALAEARLRGFRSVVRCSAQGLVATADDAPVFAIFGRRIVTPPARPSVERDRVVRAALQCGYTLAEESTERESLRHADEIFYSDVRGITALSACDGRSLTDIIAHRIAAHM